MVAFRLSTAMLGRTRFCFSPLAELASALSIMALPSRSAVHRRWLSHTLRATQDLDLRLLTSLVPAGPWLPSFPYQPIGGPHATIDRQLDLLEQNGIEPIAAEMAAVWRAASMPDVLRDVLQAGDAGLRTITAALRMFWHRAVEPHWPAIQSVLEDDVAHRARRIVAGGMYDLLEDIHPETMIDGDLLRINKPHHADQDVINNCRRLTLVPSVFSYPRLIIDHDETDHLVVVYGAWGVGRAWEGLLPSGAASQSEVGDHLAALLGGTRAGILARLRVPMTTTQLASELDQSASTISAHLSCLRDAGLLATWRRGRRVYYRQTALAGSLIEAGRRPRQ